MEAKNRNRASAALLLTGVILLLANKAGWDIAYFTNATVLAALWLQLAFICVGILLLGVGVVLQMREAYRRLWSALSAASLVAMLTISPTAKQISALYVPSSSQDEHLTIASVPWASVHVRLDPSQARWREVSDAAAAAANRKVEQMHRDILGLPFAKLVDEMQQRKERELQLFKEAQAGHKKEKRRGPVKKSIGLIATSVMGATLLVACSKSPEAMCNDALTHVADIGVMEGAPANINPQLLEQRKQLARDTVLRGRMQQCIAHLTREHYECIMKANSTVAINDCYRK